MKDDDRCKPTPTRPTNLTNLSLRHFTKYVICIDKFFSIRLKHGLSMKTKLANECIDMHKLNLKHNA